ncbi:MAG: sigma-54-dependent Fis family transcriptional regulator, partial [Gammaproteobacteria bacterium]|nr:sigma-54-dependent Fis family transcriptional regulator [Gammaproteobacteria bacterium]
THKDLGHMVEQGTFRQDLFYRINVIELRIPPLRERQEDIPVLTDSILAKQAALYGQKKPKIERDALQQLMNYPFPGNVRELENILERATTLCEEGRIKRSDLQLNSRDQSLPVADPDLPLEACLEKVERDIISNALETTRWNRTAAAKKLGISFRQLRYRLQKLGLDKEQ